jgi:hypothetical protein
VDKRQSEAMRADMALDELRKDAKISADVWSVMLRLGGLAFPDMHKMCDTEYSNMGEMSVEECQLLGIHPDNPVAQLLHIYKIYLDKR